MARLIQIVNPTIDRGKKMRDLTMKDIITVPVDYARGKWRIVDLLDGPTLAGLHRRFYRDR